MEYTGYVGLFLSLVIVCVKCQNLPATTQADLDTISTGLEIYYNVTTNNYTDTQFLALIILRNNHTANILTTSDWEIRFCHKNKITVPEEFLVNLRADGIEIRHIKGCMYTIKPYGNGFRPRQDTNSTAPPEPGIAPAHQYAFPIVAERWSVVKSDVFPKWYVNNNGSTLQPKVIANTRDVDFFVLRPVDLTTQVLRKLFEANYYLTPFQRFLAVADTLDIEQVPSSLNVPSPLAINFQPPPQSPTGTPPVTDVTIDQNWRVKADAQYQQLAQTIVDLINSHKEISGVRLWTNTDPDDGIIEIQINNAVPFIGPTLSANPEAYNVAVQRINPNVRGKVFLQANSEVGIFYGAQSMMGILGIYDRLPLIARMDDQPRTAYRAIELDVTENFHGVTTIKKLIDGMAMYKLNYLVLWLGSDWGWRVEIPGLEELTAVGSKRCHDPEETKCLSPGLGSGPDADDSGSGYYTVNDYKDILAYARKKFVTVVPRFNFLGRMRSAVLSMKARFNKYKETDMQKATQFLLHDAQETAQPDQNPFYLSPSDYKVKYYNDGVMNPCIDKTSSFVTEVIAKMKALHDQSNHPLRFLHVGGEPDLEVFWKKHQVCSAQTPAQMDRLRAQYLTQLYNTAMKPLGVSMMVAEEGVLQPRSALPFTAEQLPILNEIFVTVWNTLLGELEKWGMTEEQKQYLAGRTVVNLTQSAPGPRLGKPAFGRAYDIANAGYKVILNSYNTFRFDIPYEMAWEEEGDHDYARIADLFRVFKTEPLNIYQNMDLSYFGAFVDPQLVCRLWDCPALTAPANIVGLQATVGTTNLRSFNELFESIFPRLLAFAERSWKRGAFENTITVHQPFTPEMYAQRNYLFFVEWTNFLNTLGYKELERLDDAGIPYRIPLPGIAVLNGTYLNRTWDMVGRTEIPGLPIEVGDTNGFRPLANINARGLEGQSFAFRTKASHINATRYSREVLMTLSPFTVYPTRDMIMQEQLIRERQMSQMGQMPGAAGGQMQPGRTGQIPPMASGNVPQLLPGQGSAMQQGGQGQMFAPGFQTGTGGQATMGGGGGGGGFTGNSQMDALRRQQQSPTAMAGRTAG